VGEYARQEVIHGRWIDPFWRSHRRHAGLALCLSP
jgi:hypothetical protein